MPAMRRLAILVTLLACGLAFAAGTYKVGDEVADATLAMADGKDAKLSSHEGKAVLLFFYGTWGRHAAEEAKQIDALRRDRTRQKLVVIGVARDAKAKDAKQFGEDHKLGFAQASDPKAEFYGKFATKGLPWVALLDGKRVLKYSAAGVDDEAIETALTQVLGAKDPPPEKKPEERPPADGGGKK
jgi:peroxiredoxin